MTRLLSIAEPVILLLICGCKPRSVTYRPPQAVKEYCNYIPGSYWIMRDSLTGEVDSFAVVGNTSITTEDANYDRVYYELISIDIRRYSASEPADSITYSVELGIGGSSLEYLNHKSGLHFFAGPLGETYPMTVTHASVNILNRTYSEVTYSGTEKYGQPQPPHFFQHRHFINNTSGFLKIEAATDASRHIWELVRSSIKKQV